jgi:plasmid rolling circle replication initiator protein Rep
MNEIKNNKFLKMNDKKMIAKSNANYFMEMSCKKEYQLKKYTLENRANNILKCLDFWLWHKYEKSKILDLKKVYRCKDLFCSNCRTVKNIKAIYRFNPYFKIMLDDGFIPFFMTLTNPNCKGNELSREIDKMNEAFRTFWLWINVPIGKNK